MGCAELSVASFGVAQRVLVLESLNAIVRNNSTWFQGGLRRGDQFGLHLATECDTHRKRSHYLFGSRTSATPCISLCGRSPPTPVIFQPSHVPFTRFRCVVGCPITGCIELVGIAYIFLKGEFRAMMAKTCLRTLRTASESGFLFPGLLPCQCGFL